MMQLYVERAGFKDGMDILDLGYVNSLAPPPFLLKSTFRAVG